MNATKDQGRTKSAADKLDEAAVIVSVNVKNPRARAKLTDAKVEASDGTEPDMDSLSISKDLFKSVLFKKVRTEQRAARSLVACYALSSGDYLAPGNYLVPVTVVEEVFLKLDEQTERVQKAIDAFCEAYPQIVADARIRLKGAFDESDFPPVEQVRESFLVEGKPVRARVRVRGSVPTKGISKVFLQKQLRDAENEVQGLVREVRDGLRAGLLTLVRELAEKVKAGPDAESKRFIIGPKLAAVKQFIEDLKFKNVTEDGELAKLAKQAKDILEGVEQPDLKDNSEIRDRVVQELSGVANTLDGMVTGRAKRKLNLEQEEA